MLPNTSLQPDTKKGTGIIFLIGFMGCGKTTLGRKLAAKMGYDFIDLDEVLEQQAGMTITDYFASHGEAKFRELESKVLKETAYPENAIVSTGGGLPCFFDHMDWMNSHGRTFYIKLNPKTLASRLESGKEERPLLREKHGDALISFIQEKLNEREACYNQATFVVDGLSLSTEKAAQIITE